MEWQDDDNWPKTVMIENVYSTEWWDRKIKEMTLVLPSSLTAPKWVITVGHFQRTYQLCPVKKKKKKREAKRSWKMKVERENEIGINMIW